jgi:hypothetical protein
MVRIILIPLVLLILQVPTSLLLADDHKTGGRPYNQREIRKEHHEYEDHNGRQVEKDAEGNEFTGQMAAWLLVSANLNVVISILARFVNRFVDPGGQLRSSMKRLNQFQMRYLRKLHYVLNPIAVSIAFLHFLLSSCRSSPLPEWGLLFTAMMVVLGLMLRFKVSFKWTRRVVYRLHTAPATFTIMICLLVVGHLIAD